MFGSRNQVMSLSTVAADSAAVTSKPSVRRREASERFTVIDVFANDAQGLLYTLAQTLFNHGLTVHLARIATNIDQVVDVFYVLDEHQRKLEDPERIERLKTALLEEIRGLSGA